MLASHSVMLTSDLEYFSALSQDTESFYNGLVTSFLQAPFLSDPKPMLLVLIVCMSLKISYTSRPLKTK